MAFFSGFNLSILLAIRARYLLVSTILIFSLVFISLLSSAFSGRQPSTVALDVGISVIRFFLPFVAVFLSQELIVREFERRYFLGSFSYPVTRVKFLLGRISAIGVLVFLLLFVMCFFLLGLVKFVGVDYVQSTPVDLGWGYFLVVSFVALDLFVSVAVACFFGVAASTPSFVFIGTFGFVLVARSYSSIINLISRDSGVVMNSAAYGDGLVMFKYFFPDLGSLDIREVALYARMEFFPTDWLLMVLSNLAYALGIVLLAVVVVVRRRFA